MSMWKSGYKLGKIKQCLEEDSLTVSKKSLCLLIRKYRETGSVANKKAARRPTKLVDRHYQFIDAAMATNDELSAPKLHRLLQEQFPDLAVSLGTVKRA